MSANFPCVFAHNVWCDRGCWRVVAALSRNCFWSCHSSPTCGATSKQPLPQSVVMIIIFLFCGAFASLLSSSSSSHAEPRMHAVAKKHSPSAQPLRPSATLVAGDESCGYPSSHMADAKCLQDSNGSLSRWRGGSAPLMIDAGSAQRPRKAVGGAPAAFVLRLSSSSCRTAMKSVASLLAA